MIYKVLSVYYLRLVQWTTWNITLCAVCHTFRRVLLRRWSCQTNVIWYYAEKCHSYGILSTSYRSKEKGFVWNQIAVNLSGPDHPKFKVNKRSMRDRLTLLIIMHKGKIRQQKNASGIDHLQRDRTKLNQALEEIIDWRIWPTKKAPR